MMLDHWIDRVDGPAVLVTVVETKGSTPRDVGARMLVHHAGFEGTIGGGELEWRALQLARERLRARRSDPETRAFPLGPELGQCCGGFVRLLFEAFTEVEDLRRSAARSDAAQGGSAVLARRLHDGVSGLIRDRARVEDLPAAGPHLELVKHGKSIDNLLSQDDPILVERTAKPKPHIWVFGAGHVGRALTDVLGRLPRQRVIWVDERQDVFPEVLPRAVTKLWARVPEAVVPRILGGGAVVVMTHSHARDLAVIDRALARPELGFIGLIGSRTKRARFERRLLDAGHEAHAVARLVCPIGDPAIVGKEPEVIAIAIAAQLLAHYGGDPRYG